MVVTGLVKNLDNIFSSTGETIIDMTGVALEMVVVLLVVGRGRETVDATGAAGVNSVAVDEVIWMETFNTTLSSIRVTGVTLEVAIVSVAVLNMSEER